eukprot:13757613-Heterocapsa_arctica.AAC.1
MKALTGATNAFVLKNIKSALKEFCPMASKNLQDTVTALRYFSGTNIITHVYSDSSGEIIRACEELEILHEPSRPGVPQSNA